MSGILEGRKLTYILGVSNILLLAIVGYLVFFDDKTPSGTSNEEQQRYPFLSKRIFTENQNDILVNFVELRSILREYINSTNARVGLYFEYLPSGTSIGVNDTELFAQASLIKVPIVMAVYNEVAQGRMRFDEKLTIKNEHIDKEFGTLYKQGVGSQISVEEAAKKALVESDNTATKLLIDALPTGAADTVFDSLDIPKNKEGNAPLVSAKAYSSIFRSLYLSSYLSREDSNKILGLLAQSTFSDQIVAGVDEEIEVAHKFGVVKSDKDPGNTIYSDCGIVYVPRRPYMICVMTEDVDKEKADSIIRTASDLVHDYVTLVN